MSSGQSIYIGAYLEVTLKPLTDTGVRKCPEHGAGHVGALHNCCTICGSAIETLYNVHNEYPSFLEIMGKDYMGYLTELDFEETDIDKLIVVSDDDEDDTHISLDKDSEGVYNLEEYNPLKTKHIMRIKYAIEIRRLMEHPLVSEVKDKHGAIILWY